jgi:RecJ-like exonuclease
MHFLLERAQKLADIIACAEKVHIVTHIDADGITAGAIASATLERLGKPCSLECVKQLDDTVLSRLQKEQHELVWFTDLGSSISTEYPTITKIVTDHHGCPADANQPFHLNPHLFGLDGTYELSGAGATYLVSKAADKNNVDLAALAIVGACGDLQDKKLCKLSGINRAILEDGRKAGVIDAKIDIRYFGRETRPIHKLLQYSTDPIIPGLSGREEACTLFLQDLDVRLKDGDYWRRWVDLDKTERQKIMSAVAHRLLTSGFGYKLTQRIIGETYLLLKEEHRTELHDAKEFATLLNATARYGQHEVGLKVCRGDRGDWLKKARNLLQGHRHNLVEGLQFAREEQIHKRDYLQFFHAGDGIRDTIIGIVTNMMLHSADVDSSLPLIGFATTDNGDVKVSARSTQELVDRGLNLSIALKKAAQTLDGIGGGHKIAAGATIPKGKEEKFLAILEEEIKNQIFL